MNISKQMEMQKNFSEIGQSIWIDTISREMLLNNSLKNMIEKLGVTGLTSNPTIFEQAIINSKSYDESIKMAVKKTNSVEEICYFLMIEDIQRACDILAEIYKKTQGTDGYASIEIPPDIDKKQDIINWATDLYSKISRPNVMIKIPATKEGIEAMEELVKSGINVNMTLIFSPETYEEIAKAYLRAVEFRAQNNMDPDVFSVASFFVSRIDSVVDKKLEELASNTKEIETKSFILSLRGKAAISTAIAAYEKYLKFFFTDNFKNLSEKGFRPQKILWASTSTKNPSYKDTLYADELCLSNSINTLPTQTLYSFLEHGAINKNPIGKRIEESNYLISNLKKLEIDLNDIFSELLRDGILKFKISYKNIIEKLEIKLKELSTQTDTLIQIFNLDISAYQKELKEKKFIERLYSKDATLWKEEKEHVKIIKNSLGWLDVVKTMEKNLTEIEEFTNKILKEKKYKYCVLMGMGGSSLAPEVLRSLFEKNSYLKTYVLDSTNPDWIGDVEKNISLKETLFIFSSKSGGTVEPNTQFKYFYSKIKKLSKKPGEHFIAITDSGTSLEALAKKNSFRKIFINPSDIGGRFSALSYFGLVPASLFGSDIKKLISKGNHAYEQTKSGDPTPLALGSFMGLNHNTGRDKLTVILPQKLKRFGLWIEQLIAESTGKEGKGILPVIETEIKEKEYYDKDRMFVVIQFKNFISEEIESKTNSLISQGAPVLKMYIKEPHDIAEQFYFWEIATAVCGYFMKINPFDQPDVASTKELTKKILEKGNISLKPDYSISGIDIYKANIEIEKLQTIDDLIWTILNEKEEAFYYSICAYLNETEKNDKILSRFSYLLTKATQNASISSYGPRYLHSTGQLFKGGSNKGIFLILTSKSKKDIKILGENYSFEKLCLSQAKGDFLALKEKGRKVIMIFVKKSEYEKELNKILKKLENLTADFEEGNMPKTAIKNRRTTTKAVEDGYVVIDYPKHMETITSRHYTIRIGTSEAKNVEVSIDNGPWQSARHSVGYWWYDWNNITPGNHEIIAKMHKNNGSFLISKRRRCKVV